MPHLSQMLSFLQSPFFQQAQSALIGQLTQSIVIGRTLDFTISSSPWGTESVM